MFSLLLFSFLLFTSLTLSTPIMMHSDYHGMTLSLVDPPTGNISYITALPSSNDVYLIAGMCSNPDGTELLFSTGSGITYRTYQGKNSWVKSSVILRAFRIGFWVKESTYLVGDSYSIVMLNAITGDMQFVVGIGTNETYGDFYYDRDSQLLWVTFSMLGDTEKLSLRTYHFDGMKATLIRQVVVKISLYSFKIYPLLNPTDQSVMGGMVINGTSITSCNVNPVSGDINYLNKITLLGNSYFMSFRVDPNDPQKLFSFYEGYDPYFSYVYMLTFDRQTMKLLSHVKVNFNYLGKTASYGNAGFGFGNREMI